MMRALTPYFLVALGAALGGLLRVSSTALIPATLTFPMDSLPVNVLGSLLIGIYMALPPGRFMTGPSAHLFVTAGFCGGLTTFSLFSLEMMNYWQHAAWWAAVGLIFVSVTSWLLAAFGGYHLTRWLTGPQNPARP